ncbi:hypothetical protein PAPHI01_0365 [Pancytospora philotis]|nr:hypothetical protein PAPHI01_0339 [Pancytospora philotis]KAI4291091.1 hypothetical protein PAPHI01_0365 [Pancytospora philotis]
MNNNNLFNGNFFQQTPQKPQGWSQPQQQFGLGNPAGGSMGGVPLGMPALGAPGASGTSMMGGAMPNTMGAPMPGAMGSPMNNPMQMNPAGSAPLGNQMAGTQPFGAAPQQFMFNKPANPVAAYGAPTGMPAYGSAGSSLMSGAMAGSTPSTFGQPLANSWQSTPSPLAMYNKGSKVASYATTRIKEDTGLMVDCMDISAMKEYADKSIDIIRLEDYEQGRKPAAQAAGSVSSLSSTSGLPTFGSSMVNAVPKPLSVTPASTGLFSSSFPTTAQPTAQQPGLYGSMPSAFGTNPAPSAPAAPSSLFFGTASNASMLNPTASNTSLVTPQPLTSSLNAPTSTSTPLFGANPSAPSMFGSTPSFGSMQASNPAPQVSTATSNPAPFSFPSSSPFGAQQNQPAPNPFAAATTSTAPSSTFPLNSTAAAPASNPFAANPFGSFMANKAPVSTAPVFGNSFASNGTGFAQNPFGQASSSFAAQPQQVAYNDPYLITGLEFEKVEPQKPSVKTVLPTPIFSNKKPEAAVPFVLRPPAKNLGSKLRTVPALREPARDLSNFTIIAEGTGKVVYMEPVNVEHPDKLDKIVRFSNENVEITDEPGTGLNRRARVYIENVFPYSRSSSSFIKGQQTDWLSKSVQERFVYQLKNDSHKKFVDYDVETGTYVYEVVHF